MTRSTLLFDAALLQPYLGGAWLLLTPNRRLASRIRSAVAAQQPAAAAAAPVLALGDWLEQLWQQMLFRGDPLTETMRGAESESYWVLNAAQELCLWEEAVRASAMPLLRPGQAAEQAAAAYRTLALWQQLPLSAELRGEFEHNPDSRAFAEWLDRFEQLCAAKNCIAGAERDLRVARAAQHGRLLLPQRVLGIGFDDIPPLQRGILQSVGLQNTGEFRELELPNRQLDAVCVGADSLEEQLQAAALWVQEQLQAEPKGPFAIVVPDLTQQRTLVERVLLDVLTPEINLPGSARQLPPLNFSAGEPLAQTPPVRAALQLLELAQPYAERDTLLELLQSPFHRIDAKETPVVELTDENVTGLPVQEKIAAAIAMLCDLRSQQISAAQLRRIADEIAQRGGWSFASALQQLAERVRRDRLQSVRFTAAKWATLFDELLELLGWPGSRTLDSIEYQQHEQWQQTLLQFGQFDRVLEVMDFNSALQRLRQVLQVQVFQPKTDDLPIQVLGVLEAAGLQFKGLWLCDMSDDRWPAAAAPQPLLPRDLQRRLRMPRCDAQREFEIAAKLSRSLLNNAERVVVSYQREREEVERAPSPLFQQLPEVALNDLLGGELLELLPLWQRQQHQRAVFALESFAGGNAPVLTDSERARGGSALFKAQADCPFQAFAKLRLKAQPLREPVAGLDAAERGNLLHSALEWLWRELKEHAALIALSAAEQQALAESAASKAIAQLDTTRIGLRFTQLEQRRLAKLLFAWLKVERERGAFTVIATEEKKSLTFARLQLRLRIDRIDRLPDGRLMLIDYKSKMANSSAQEWLGERPDEPQLPLYGVLWEQDSILREQDDAGEQNATTDLFAEPSPASNNGEIAGIAFAQVRLENPRLVGVGDEQLDDQYLQAAAQLSVDGSNRSWTELKQYWRNVLENLAAEFIDGVAVVQPKAPKVCTYCELASVCRIDHQRLDDAEVEDDDI